MPFARLVIDLLLLRRGPQDMPGGTTVLYAGICAYCILLFLQIRMIASSGGAVFQVLISVVILALYARALLRLRGYPHRVVQTLSALFVTSAAITLLMLGPTLAVAPFVQALGQVSDPSQLPKPSAMAMVAYVVIGFWGVAVSAHIYRHALQTSFWIGLGAALGYEVLLMFVFSLLGRMGL